MEEQNHQPVRRCDPLDYGPVRWDRVGCCAGCHTHRPPMLKCGGCGLFYCSKRCQTADWTRHKRRCWKAEAVRMRLLSDRGFRHAVSALGPFAMWFVYDLLEESAGDVCANILSGTGADGRTQHVGPDAAEGDAGKGLDGDDIESPMVFRTPMVVFGIAIALAAAHRMSARPEGNAAAVALVALRSLSGSMQALCRGVESRRGLIYPLPRHRGSDDPTTMVSILRTCEDLLEMPLTPSVTVFQLRGIGANCPVPVTAVHCSGLVDGDGVRRSVPSALSLHRLSTSHWFALVQGKEGAFIVQAYVGHYDADRWLSFESPLCRSDDETFAGTSFGILERPRHRGMLDVEGVRALYRGLDELCRQPNPSLYADLTGVVLPEEHFRSGLWVACTRIDLGW